MTWPHVNLFAFVPGMAAIGLGNSLVAVSLNRLLLADVPPERAGIGGGVTVTLQQTGYALGVATLGTLFISTEPHHIAGAAYGLGFLGPFQSLSPLAQPHERAALISAFYIVAYLAFSIPALVAGLLITDVGLRSTSLGYDTIVALVVAGTMLYEIRAARRTRSAA